MVWVPEVGGGVQPCKRSFLLCKQSPVYCLPLLQSLHVGRTLAKLSLNLRGWSHWLCEKAVGVICLLFTDGAIQFTKHVLSVCTRWNVNCDNNNGRELPRQIERSTLHKHKLHQRWTVFWYYHSIVTPFFVDINTQATTAALTRKCCVSVCSVAG